MILQALVGHLLEYRSCRVGSVVAVVAVMLPVRMLYTAPA